MRRAGLAVALVLGATACRGALPKPPAQPGTARAGAPAGPFRVHGGASPVEDDFVRPIFMPALRDVPARRPTRVIAPAIPRKRPAPRARTVVFAPWVMSPGLARAEQWRSLKHHPEALEAYDQVLARPVAGDRDAAREATYARYRKAHVLIAAGHRAGAVELLEYLAGTQSPERLAALDDLAEIYVQDGDRDPMARLQALAPGLEDHLRPHVLDQLLDVGDHPSAAALLLASASPSDPCSYCAEAVALDPANEQLVKRAFRMCPALRENRRLVGAEDRPTPEIALLALARGSGFDADAWQALADRVGDEHSRVIALVNVAESRGYHASRELTDGVRSAAAWVEVAEAYQAIPRYGQGVVADVETLRFNAVLAWSNAATIVRKGGDAPPRFAARARAGLATLEGGKLGDLAASISNRIR